jgi:hypothetical protein
MCKLRLPENVIGDGRDHTFSSRKIAGRVDGCRVGVVDFRFFSDPKSRGDALYLLTGEPSKQESTTFGLEEMFVKDLLLNHVWRLLFKAPETASRKAMRQVQILDSGSKQ